MSGSTSACAGVIIHKTESDLSPDTHDRPVCRKRIRGLRAKREGRPVVNVIVTMAWVVGHCTSKAFGEAHRITVLVIHPLHDQLLRGLVVRADKIGRATRIADREGVGTT